MTLRRRIHDEASLAELAEGLEIPAAELERDYLLVSIAAQLESDFAGAFCFKGGFVLRHVHGQPRLSADIDATRHNPPRHKLDANDVRKSIARSGRGVFTVRVADADTDTGVSLDFADVAYKGPLGNGRVAVEVSYREAIVLPPVEALIGEPFFDPFPVPVMAPEEIVAEKLRTLAQRRRPTDLSDIAFLLATVEVDKTVIREVARSKFLPGLVQPGDHESRIRANIDSMSGEYEATVQAVAPGSAPYSDASSILLRDLRNLLP